MVQRASHSTFQGSCDLVAPVLVRPFTAAETEDGHLIGQLLVESVLLAIFGGLAGLIVARWTLVLIRTLLPPEAITTIQFELIPQVILFAAALSIATGLFFGLFPALRVSEVDLRDQLEQGGRATGDRGGVRVRAVLAGAQLAVALILLVGAGLLLRTFSALHRVDLGYEPQGVISAYLALNGDRYPEAADRNAFVDELEARVGSLPGVEAVGVVSTLPLSGANADVDFRVTNLVSRTGSTVRVLGTQGNDQFTFSAGTDHQIAVNGVAYQFDAAVVSSVTFHGMAGYDAAELTGATALIRLCCASAPPNSAGPDTR